MCDEANLPSLENIKPVTKTNRLFHGFFSEACLILGSKPEPCVFPFTYKNQTFNECTNTDADPGTVWCATETDQQDVVIEERWGDCAESCPGASTYSQYLVPMVS